MPRIIAAEWEEHEALWAAWPSHPALWGEDLEPARHEVADFLRAIADLEDGVHRGEALKIVADGADAAASARILLDGLHVEVFDCAFGDIWIRDTGPVFVIHDDELRALAFRFNGWGRKYLLDGDERLSERLAALEKTELERHFWTLEGGSIESDGEGTLLVTKSGVLNPNRNPNLSQKEVEHRLSSALGAKRIIWLDCGLTEDFTDCRVDNLARFIAPNHVMVMEAQDRSDPNYALYRSTIKVLEQACVDVTIIPSTGRVEDADGVVLPGSYLNFVIGNTTVVVPHYGGVGDEDAILAIESAFPTKRIVGIRADHLLSGGGAFHSLSLTVPKWPY